MRTLLSLLLAADASALAVGAAPGKCSVWVVGCGLPKRGMGWYHAKQIVDDDVPSASLTAVVEPWFLGAGADSAPGAAFGEWASEMEAKGVAMHASVDALPSSAEDAQPTLALISGRTADNPRLLKEVISKGCSAVYLEKPGAPTVAELEEMRAYAKSKGVPVYMGYNKNVTPYVRLALDAARRVNGPTTTTYVHNNAYKTEELPECFERNAEGMLKNMAIHELALLATYWDVRVDTIASVVPDTSFSSCETLVGPSGSEFTDFSKVGFTITTKSGQEITLKIDRCGSDAGGNSIAIVEQDGNEIFTAETPDVELSAKVDAAAKADPEMMPYFFLQSDDYVTLKEATASHTLERKQGAPEGIATIEVAIEALKLAEYLTPVLQEALAA